MSPLSGTALVTRTVLPSMIAAKNGHIVTISSIHGIHTSGNASASCATKFAFTGFSEPLAKGTVERRDNSLDSMSWRRVDCIPGYTTAPKESGISGA